MRSKVVFLEFLLIFASVLVFRSIWMLLDRIPEMKNEFGLWASLILGTIVALIALLMINRYAEKKKNGTLSQLLSLTHIASLQDHLNIYKRAHICGNFEVKRKQMAFLGGKHFIFKNW